MWYGFFFALGFLLAYRVFQSLLTEFLAPYQLSKAEILKITEKVSFYVIIGTIVGARLGDVLFYQSPALYVHNPVEIIKFWEGGLSSHGGVIGIMVSIWVLCQRLKRTYPMITLVAMFDLLCIPALLAGAFIRIGNFFNQEIIGIPTTLPWAIIFGNPADGSPILPRHPAQLYEAFFYFTFFALLWTLRTKNPKVFLLGKTSGLFFMGTFIFRFLVEFAKAPQSALLKPGSIFDMGQLLSVPLILVGALLFFGYQNRLRARSVKGH